MKERQILKNTPRLFLVLSISVLGIVVFANAQKSNVFVTDTSTLRRAHLALSLVRYPELNRAQQRIILDAISSSRPEFASSGKAEEELLRKYNAVSALAMNQRKAAFSNASFKERSELWRTHLALYLVKRPELNELQQETVLDAMALAMPDWFEVASHKDAKKSDVEGRLRSLEERIVAAFSKEERARIFATLGSEAAQCASSLNQLATVLPNIVNYIEVSNSSLLNGWSSNELAWQELERAPCQCSTESDWCPLTGRCNGSNCTRTDSGCGTLWSYACNGASCQDDEKPTPSPTQSPKPSPRSSPSKETI